jgi:hypothetical protein
MSVEMSVEEMSVEEMSVEEMSVEEMSLDEMTCCPPFQAKTFFFILKDFFMNASKLKGFSLLFSFKN